MAKGAYGCIDSVSRNVPQIPLCVDLVSRNTKAGYACVDGVSRKFFGGSIVGTPLSDYDVGTSVYLNVNGVRTQFVVVHKGLPGTTNYDSSCDGIWLLMKDIYEKRQWHSSNVVNADTSYSESTIHSYLNSTFLNSLDSGVKSVIKTVKIPYTVVVRYDAMGEELEVPSVETSGGSNGLSTRIFLLSGVEVGYSGSSLGYEGNRLDYFSSISSRIGYYNGTATGWYLRSPATDSSGVWIVYKGGDLVMTNATVSYGIRPAFVLPSDIQVDSNFNIIA